MSINKILCCLFFSTLLWSNNFAQQNETSQSNADIELNVQLQDKKNAEKIILGTWEGTLDDQPITIVLERLFNGEFIGYNIVEDKKSYMKGIFNKDYWNQPCGHAFTVHLKEVNNNDKNHTFIIQFVGYERETTLLDDQIECLGDAQGQEALGKRLAYNQHSKQEIRLKKK